MSAFRFGLFVFDAGSGELTRDGRPVRLQPRPAQVLAALLSRPGEIVSRDDLRRAVWPTDTYVDFDRGLNFCIAQVRSALGDDAGSPRYIRTVPKRGYEFVCPVEPLAPAAADPDGGVTAARNRRRRPGAKILVAAAAAVCAIAAVLLARARPASRDLPIVAVARFDNDTGDPTLSRFGDTLVDTVVEQLTIRGAGRFSVVGNAAVLRTPREERDLNVIATSLGARYVVLTQLQRDAERLRVLAHLIRLPDQTHVQVSRTEGIADRTLASTDAIALRIASAFAGRVEPADSRSSSRAANH